MGPKSFWSPYIDVLPTSEEVNPTLIWPEEDLALLEGSSLVAATRSLKKKLQVGNTGDEAKGKESITGLKDYACTNTVGICHDQGEVHGWSARPVPS